VRTLAGEIATSPVCRERKLDRGFPLGTAATPMFFG
jgi:hypothetical protein